MRYIYGYKYKLHLKGFIRIFYNPFLKFVYNRDCPESFLILKIRVFDLFSPTRPGFNSEVCRIISQK